MISEICHVYSLKVYLEDTDLGGIVYHSKYLNFAERARSELLLSMGFNFSNLDNNINLFFVVKNMKINYIKPAYLHDDINVRTKVTNIKGARLELVQQIIRNNSSLAELDSTLALVNSIGRPKNIPTKLYKALLSKIYCNIKNSGDMIDGK